jgi:hypothetical protein
MAMTFTQAGRAESPKLLEAEIQKAQLEQQKAQAEQVRRHSNMTTGVSAYKASPLAAKDALWGDLGREVGMFDSTAPIADLPSAGATNTIGTTGEMAPVLEGVSSSAIPTQTALEAQALQQATMQGSGAAASSSAIPTASSLAGTGAGAITAPTLAAPVIAAPTIAAPAAAAASAAPAAATTAGGLGSGAMAGLMSNPYGWAALAAMAAASQLS